MDDQQLADLLENQRTRIPHGHPFNGLRQDAVSSVHDGDEDLRAAIGSLELLDRVWPSAPIEDVGSAVNFSSLLGSVFSLPGFGSLRKLGRFEIVRELGRGGSGIVFLAFDPQLQRQVALKAPKPEVLASAELRERFVGEGRVLAKLVHPNIAPVYEAGADGPVAFIASAFFPVGDLGEWLQRQPGRISHRTTAAWMAAIANALQHAHAHGILHRDLKPSNVFLEAIDGTVVEADLNLRPRLGDFGLAKQQSNEPGLTSTKAVLGTPAYMSPEQAAGRPGEIAATSDVFSLGAVLYELLTGVQPFRGVSDYDILQQVIGVDPTPPVKLEAGVPRDLSAICMKCLEKEPLRRYRSAGQIAEELQRYLDGRPILARPSGAIERVAKWATRQPALATVTAATALAIVLLAAFGIAYAIHVSQLNRSLKQSLAQSEELQIEADRQRQKAQQGLYAYDMPFVYQLIRAGDHRAATVRLNSYASMATTQDDLRGFEWHYLNRQCRFLPHLEHWTTIDGPIVRIAVSHDGKTIAAWKTNANLQLFDAERCESLGALPLVCNGEAAGLEFNAEDELLAVSGQAKAPELAGVEIFDVRKKSSVAKLRDRVFQVGGVAFLQSGPEIALGMVRPDNIGEIRVWDFKSGSSRIVSGEHALSSHPLAVTADGKRIVAAALDRLTISPTGGNAWEHVFLGHEGMIFDIAVSPNGKMAASAGRDKTIRIWNLDAHSPITTLQGRNSYLVSLAFSPDNTQIAAADGNSISIWSIADRKCGFTLPLTSAIANIRYAADGKSIFICGENGIDRWFPAATADSFTDIHLKEQIWSLAFTPDGKRLAIGHDNSHGPANIEIYETKTRKKIVECRGHTAMVPALAFSADGERLVSGGLDQTMRIWDGKSGKSLRELTAHRDRGTRVVAFSRDGKVILSTGYDGLAKVWDASQGTALAELNGHGGRRVFAGSFLSDGQRVVTGGLDGKVIVWDVASQSVVRTTQLPDNAQAWSIAVSPDGKQLAVGDHLSTIQILDLESGVELGSLSGHKGGIRALAYSPDGKTLASAGQDKTVRLWQPATGRELLVLRGHNSQVNAVVFHPNGRLLVSGDHDGRVRFWESETDNP